MFSWLWSVAGRWGTWAFSLSFSSCKSLFFLSISCKLACRIALFRSCSFKRSSKISMTSFELADKLLIYTSWLIVSMKSVDGNVQNVTKLLFRPTYWHLKKLRLQTQSRKEKSDYYALFTHFLSVFNHIVTSFPTTNSMDVRASNLWTYVHRKNIWENGYLLSYFRHFTARENRIFALDGIFGWIYRVNRGFSKSRW